MYVCTLNIYIYIYSWKTVIKIMESHRHLGTNRISAIKELKENREKKFTKGYCKSKLVIRKNISCITTQVTQEH